MPPPPRKGWVVREIFPKRLTRVNARHLDYKELSPLVCIPLGLLQIMKLTHLLVLSFIVSGLTGLSVS